MLRIELDDLSRLEHFISSVGLKNVGLCIDIAQLFIIRGNENALDFLRQLKSMNLPVMEFHVSDVIQNTRVKNRVAMEIGTGSIDWKLILPLILQHCNDLLIETLGGVRVFQRSKMFLESLVKEKRA